MAAGGILNLGGGGMVYCLLPKREAGVLSAAESCGKAAVEKGALLEPPCFETRCPKPFHQF